MSLLSNCLLQHLTNCHSFLVFKNRFRQCKVAVINSMKKFLSVLAIASLSLSTSKVFAQEDVVTPSPRPEEVKGFYSALGVGYSAPQDATASGSALGVPFSSNLALTGGFAGEAAVGYDFGPVRTEVSFIYNNASADSVSVSVGRFGITEPVSGGNINTLSTMASVYIDIPTKSRWVPYVGGGLGYTTISFENASNKGVLGYQAKVGLSYLADKKTDIFVEGVYQGTSNFSIDSVDFDPLSSWGARLGARFRF